ncbi:hypothetical protein QWA68_005848 [Fusarium oxysporum]|nr:hypothetical protein QWA68_005848 [Fusarium oxysporum]
MRSSKSLERCLQEMARETIGAPENLKYKILKKRSYDFAADVAGKKKRALRWSLWRYSKVTTVTVKGTRVTAKPKTKTKVVTSITTKIETQYPPKVTETSFETTVSTVTEYDDRTETGTATELVTVESVIPVDHYEACSDANLLRSANGGNRISQISVKFTSRITSTSGLKNAYECCVICQQTANCLFSNWRANSVCAVYLPLTTDFCSNGQQVAASYYSSAVTTNDFVLSNGQCGKLTNGVP